MRLPSLPALRERAARLNSWAAETEGMLAASAAAAAPNANANELLRRPSVDDVLRLQRGAPLRLDPATSG